MVQPGDVTRQRVLLTLAQDPHVAVVPPGASAGCHLGQPFSEHGAALLQQTEAALRSEITGEGQTQVEGAFILSAALAVCQQLFERCGSKRRDAVNLPTSALPPFQGRCVTALDKPKTSDSLFLSS